MWLERPDQWDKLIAHLRRAGEFGLDTETYGQSDKTSPQHRARVHCWSVGLLTDTRSPRGYRRAVGRVLPHAALGHGAIRDLLSDPAVKKYAHNSPHDRHALENEGVSVAGLEDSLQYLRVAAPGRKDYGLKDAEEWALGYPSRPGFLDVVSYNAEVRYAKRRVERGCVCGSVPCRARSTTEWLDGEGVWRPHTRVTWKVFVPQLRLEPRRFAVTEFVPGAVMPPIVWEPTKTKPNPPSWWKGQPIERLQAFWEYALADAVRGMELVDWVRNRKLPALVYPWTASTVGRVS